MEDYGGQGDVCSLVKNVTYLDYTPQLQDFVKYSQLKTLEMQLWIRPEATTFGPATTLSPALEALEKQEIIHIFTIPFKQ